MNKFKYLLLLSSLGVLILLIGAAVSENFFKEWQAIQSEAKTQEGPLDERLRQVVNPNLRTVDRCVTCHVGMAPGEQAVSNSKVGAAHKNVFHNPSELGCTICHGGQGLATTKADAHGFVPFWTEPMLPTKYVYASCGTCHTPLSVPTLEVVENSRRTFERLDCYSCHRVEGRGGTLRVGGDSTGMEGPDLSGVGIRGYKADWYEKHLAKSKDSDIVAWKTAFAEISAADLKAVTDFLDSQVGASELILAKAQFNSLGCAGCHKVGNFGGDAGVDLSLSGFKDPNQLSFGAVSGDHTLSNWIAAHFRSPAATVRGSQMPALGLTEPEIDKLTMYVLSLRRRTLPDLYLPKDRVRAMRFGAREFASDGETIYASVCSACHGARGEGARFPGLTPNPSIAGREFLELASDEFLTATIAKGRSGRPMLAWGDRANGLSADEIAAVVGYVRKLGGGVRFTGDARAARWAAGDARLGERLFLANCAGCHGPRGQGIEGPAIGGADFLAIASDSFLAGTIRRGRSGTTMPAFGTPSVVRPALTDQEIEAITSFLRTMESK